MTLVSHDQRFIFLKTRKTAGSSIESYLMPWCLPPGVTISSAGLIQRSLHFNASGDYLVTVASHINTPGRVGRPGK